MRSVPVHQVAARGPASLRLGTRLLQSYRLEEPHGGIWDAADLSWWWRRPRPTDDVAQRFWLEGEVPVAGVLQTDWGNEWQSDPISLPSQGTGRREEVWAAALATGASVPGLAIPVRTDDDWARAFLAERDLVADDASSATMWMAAADAPAPTPLAPGYRLTDRAEDPDRPHHLIARNGADVEARLRQTPLYDPGLDLSVVGGDGRVAAYGVFWYDPATGVGMVEPMRTEEGHERRGLAGHLLRAGLSRLVARGARRLKIGYENPAAGSVYRRAGFVEDSTVTIFRRR